MYERYAVAIRSYAARRVEASAVDDVVAETFAIAWRRLPSQAEPLPWLYAVARRVVHGHRRSQARRAALTARLISRHGAGPAPPDPADLIEGDPRLARAFGTLTEVEREAIRLIAWEGLTRNEAAIAAGCSPATFAVRLSRAKAHLAHSLAAVADAAPRPPSPLTTVEVCHEH